MNPYLKIPLTLTRSNHEDDFAFAMIPVEVAIQEFIDILVSTRPGECGHNTDFGYSLWSNEFEPILNVMEWQPIFMEQIKELLEKYEHRITSVQVWEPEITSIRKADENNIQLYKTDKNYKITIRLDYTIKQTGERQNDVRITFEY
jgi:phage baseplate assembly protein W